MAKQGISYEAFEQAADELVRGGKKPSQLTVVTMREKVGGSNTTIMKFLAVYRAARPEPRVVLKELPENVVASLRTAFEDVATQARQEPDERLVTAEANLATMTTENEALEAQLAELQEAVRALATERDTLTGQRDQQAAEIEALKADVAGVSEKAAAAERELSVARSQVEAGNGRMAELREQSREQLNRVDGELTAARERVEQLMTSLRAAENSAAVAGAQLEAEHQAKAGVDKHLSDLQIVVKSLEGAAGRAAAAEATNEALRKTVAALEGSLQTSRDAERQALERAAEAKGLIEALRQQLPTAPAGGVGAKGGKAN